MEYLIAPNPSCLRSEKFSLTHSAWAKYPDFSSTTRQVEKYRPLNNTALSDLQKNSPSLTILSPSLTILCLLYPSFLYSLSPSLLHSLPSHLGKPRNALSVVLTRFSPSFSWGRRWQASEKMWNSTQLVSVEAGDSPQSKFCALGMVRTVTVPLRKIPRDTDPAWRCQSVCCPLPTVIDVRAQGTDT